MRRQPLFRPTVLAVALALAAFQYASHTRAHVGELLSSSRAAASGDRLEPDAALRRALGEAERQLDGLPGVHGVAPLSAALAVLGIGADAHDDLRAPRDEGADAAVALPWDDALAAAHASGGELADDAATVLEAEKLGTYIDEVLAGGDSLVTRWPVRAGSPVRYWIQPGTALAGWTLGHRRMLDEAFSEWNAAGLPVHFAEVPDSARADIVVLWRSRFDEPISGKTRWMHDRRGWIRSARVTIALRRFGGEPLDLDAVRAIGLHEVGHALGLDHTSDPMNVMAPKVRVRTLSAADRATALLLYRLPPGSLKR